ncbi:hypothetical protein [Actinosynnema sp. ALI-1.44]|uniref:hypothetical protein n=1 Tax=Actinosynnema sp. ALI-1.44 TaxID=1933779 RepID=UPI0011781ACC|nr:hypothetical protein [Actinosynnema sp. ALI-1.44]
MINEGSLVVHWNSAGYPDGTLPGVAAWAVTGGIAAAGAALALVADRLAWHAWWRATAVFVGVLFGGLGVLVAVANAPSGQPRLPVALLVAVVVLALLSPLAALSRPSPVPPGSAIVRWEGGCRSRFAIPAGAAFLLAAVALGAIVHPAAGVVLAAGGVSILALAEIRVQVTASHLRIAYGGPLRWPRTTIRLNDVRAVAVVNVDPRHHGGWGYRGSLRLLGHAALNLRRGPGLRLTLGDGVRFVLTVEDADGAAEAIRSACR